MNLDDLPCEVITHCFSYLSTKHLVKILLLENISENILQVVAENCNHLWHSKQIRGIDIRTIEGTEDIERIQGIEGTGVYTETDFDQFLQIHKILEKKSLKCPLWFHCRWENIFEMEKDLDEINMVYNGQKLGIRVDFKDPAFQVYPIFSEHDINLKITCLSLNPFRGYCIDLNNFPKLETFYGEKCEIRVDHSHPSLKTVILNLVTFSTLPTNLIKLFARDCTIRMNENHPKLEALKVLSLKCEREPFSFSSLVRTLWNKDLEHFSYIGQGAIEEDEVLTMVGPKVTSLGFSGSISAKIPSLLSSLYSLYGGNLKKLTDFSHLSSLTLWQPSGNINDCKLPPNLLDLTLYRPRGIIGYNFFLPMSLRKLSVQWAHFQDLEDFFPPEIVDLELICCEIELINEWLKPARLKRLSLETNAVSTFKAFLPCCEYLCLSDNALTEFEIEAPVLEYIDLTGSNLTDIPKLPDSLQVLRIRTRGLTLSHESEFPSSLKVLDLSETDDVCIQDCTFPPSIQELNLGGIEELGMSGVKFCKGSRLKELILSDSYLLADEYDRYDSDTINDGVIELPPGLKTLKMEGMFLENIDEFTIPQSVTFLDLRKNNLSSFEIMSHIKTLYLNENPIKSNFVGYSLKLPPNLLNFWFRSVDFQDFKITSLPPLIVDLELSNCGIKLTAGWLNTAQLKRLSLENNELSSFKAFLPCCEYLSLERNTSFKELEIEAPVLEHIDLRLTHFTSIPNLPDSLKVLRIRTRGLTLSNELELPSSLKVLDLSETDVVSIHDYTFHPSIQELNLGGIKVLKISGVKFFKGSRLKELILSNSCLRTMDEDYLTTIDDRMIELPPGLKALKLQGMNLKNIDNFTIPQSVTFLDLRKNNLRYFFVKSHIETLYLNENPIEDNFEVHEDLELRVLDLRGIGLTRFSFEMVRAEKLAQLRLGPELEVIDLSKMPANFQMLERSRGCTLIGPDTGQRYGQLINR